MADLASLTLPTWAVPFQPRQAAVDEHTVRIRAQWWREAITSRGLPGMSPVGPTLTRAQVWTTTEDVFTLLWRALAWGSQAVICGRTSVGWTASPPMCRGRRSC
jgi:Putative 8-oxoguanine DNA glycosylase OGG-like protein